MKIRTFIAVASLLLPLGAAAQILRLGSEFQVNSYTPNNQYYPAVAVGADQNFVVAWNSNGQDGDSFGVFAQRYDSAGQALDAEFQVNSYTPDGQGYPAVAAGADGGFVFVWGSSQDGHGFGVFGQRFDDIGQALGSEFQVNTYTPDAQYEPSVAAGADGAFVVAWSSASEDGDGNGVFGQRFDDTGQALGSEFRVNTYTPGDQRHPSLAVGTDGAFVVAWTSANQDGAGYSVFGQRFDDTGQALGSEFQVNTFTPDDQYLPSVAVGADGAFVVAWSSFSQDGSSNGVFGQRFNTVGQAAGVEFQVNTYTPDSQSEPAVAARADGSFVVAYLSNDQDGEGYGVFVQGFDDAGQGLGSEFQVNSYTADNQSYVAMAAGADGAFVVAWSSNGQDGSSRGIFGQRLGELTCPPFPSLTCLASNKAQLQLKLDPTDDTKDKVKWKFTGGPALEQTDFGDPTTTAYLLCIYDDGVPKMEMKVDPSGSLWSPLGSKGYKYKDAAGTSDGATKLKLLGGEADKSKLQVQGKGTNLPMPTPLNGDQFFTHNFTVFAQLHQSNGVCYGTAFNVGDVKKNGGTLYKAKN